MGHIQDEQRNAFHQNDLVMWHYCYGNKQVPMPGVVVRQEADGIVIRTRMEGRTEELHVDPGQLIAR